MPVTTTAKRALRGSKNKESINKVLMGKLEVAIRMARKSKTAEKIVKAVSLADRAAKRKVIHKNKAARIKSQLSKLMPKTAVKPAKKKVSSKK
jgi:small subunit ribosomal protein S20